MFVYNKKGEIRDSNGEEKAHEENQWRRLKRDFITTAAVLVWDNHLCSVMGEVWVWLELWDFIARENETEKKDTERKMKS